MLDLSGKILFLKEYLSNKNDSYGDEMKAELSFHFFDLGNDKSFLDYLNSEDEIKDKIDFLVSKMILHEHEDVLKSIIENYI